MDNFKKWMMDWIKKNKGHRLDKTATATEIVAFARQSYLVGKLEGKAEMYEHFIGLAELEEKYQRTKRLITIKQVKPCP